MKLNKQEKLAQAKHFLQNCSPEWKDYYQTLVNYLEQK